MNLKIKPPAIDVLEKFLPKETYPFIARYVKKYNIELTIKAARKTVLGDYRSPYRGMGHRISINGNLNQYAFFLTLVHELAHLLTYELCGKNVESHGLEWKLTFQQLMNEVDMRQLFPSDVYYAIKNYMHNPAARSSSDVDLMRVFRKYNPIGDKALLPIEELEEGTHFIIKNGDRFVRGKKLRKRYKCQKVETGELYVFHPFVEVKVV